MKRASKRCRDAFTMLELIAVIVMVGLISSIGMISLAGHWDQAKLVRSLQQIADADRKERDAARVSAIPGSIRVDSAKQKIWFGLSNKTVSIDEPLHIGEWIVFPNQSRGEQWLVSQSGQSSTYAIRLQSKRGASQWIVVVGMTGQVWLCDDTSQVNALLAQGA